MKEFLKRIYIDLFRSVGTKNKSNRDFWLKETLKKMKPGIKILDAGAGEQQYRPLCKHLDYYSQDIGLYDGEGNEGLQTGSWDFKELDYKCDIIDMPVEDGEFDAVLCTEVLEHVTDPAAVFPEFARIIKSGGELILTAPFCSLTHFAPYHYSTGFSRYYYEHHLKENDFELIEIDVNGNYFEYLAQEIRRLPSAAKSYTNKKVNLIDQLSMNLLLNKLKRLSKNDIGSNELLAFGYHILARKK